MLHARTNSINSEHVSINLQRHRSARARTTQPIGNLSMRQPAALRAKTRKGLAVKNVLEELQVLFSSLFFIFFFSFLFFCLFVCLRAVKSAAVLALEWVWVVWFFKR